MPTTTAPKRPAARSSTPCPENPAARMLAALGQSCAAAYFAPETGVSLRIETAGSEAVNVVVETPSRFLAERLRRAYSQPLRAAAAQALGRSDVALRFHVRASTPQPTPSARQDRAPAAARPWRSGGGASCAQASLDDFVVGPCNRLAFTATTQLADLSDEHALRTLALHGDWGLGKTHLLQGLARKARLEHPDRRVLCMTAEAFTNRFIEALRKGAISRFRREVRRADLLCLDDAQHFAGKPKTLKEVLHTLDETHARNGRVALVFDRSPAHLEGLPEDLRSRLLSGLVVELERPDDDTRLAIAQRLMARRGLQLSPESLALLRRTPMRSVRELQGCLARVEALHRLTAEDPAQPIGLLALQRALRQDGAVGRGRCSKPPRPQQVLQRVCELLVVDPEEVLEGDRHARVVLARSLVVTLLKELTTMSYPEIARALRRPNHSSVITAARRLEQRIASGRSCDAGPRLGEMSCEAVLRRAREAVLAAA